ncbi:hypothetical protein BURCENBC7_AP0260 [Burkholderia cenocepacia BC7]|nr:hypothetical protein BURCENBC7_AP0260 [Burkholderia cenocepacia BC7]
MLLSTALHAAIAKSCNRRRFFRLQGPAREREMPANRPSGRAGASLAR